MDAKFSVDFSNLVKQISSRIERNLPEAKRKTLERIAKDTDEFIPYKTGRLSKSVEIKPADSSILYSSEYASFAFNPVAPSGVPKQYTKTVHQNAQGYPLQASYSVHDAEWAEYFREELMKGVK